MKNSPSIINKTQKFNTASIAPSKTSMRKPEVASFEEVERRTKKTLPEVLKEYHEDTLLLSPENTKDEVMLVDFNIDNYAYIAGLVVAGELTLKYQKIDRFRNYYTY